MSEYKTDVLRGHDYDGIEEYDNRLPNWWLIILYGTCVFALGYWLVFHTFRVVDLPLARYDQEMIAAAEAQLAKMAEGGITDESLMLMATLPETVARGRELFSTYCVVCHLDRGQGLVGPNLTDGHWLNGGAPTDILKTVTDGVPAKGMAAWGGQLGPSRVQDLVAFVISIKNTNVPGKAPEGEPEAAGAGIPPEGAPDNG
ncbi:c-type cytochrome [bacterium]|nr:c-type cytochrome [bacterium]MBU1074085.1 c-type cytochrome [bacterium]MBU1676948.1 c-type cytochrome [bacterium]